MLQLAALIGIPMVGGALILGTSPNEGERAFQVKAEATITTPTSAVVAATPSTFATVFARATSGQTIRLAPGTYPTIRITGRQFGTPVVIDAAGAVLTEVAIASSSGITLQNGTLRSPGSTGYGILVRSSSNIRVRNMTVSGSQAGIGVLQSTNVDLDSNTLTGLRSDGINIAASQYIVVRSNRCSNFNPVPAVYSASGQLITDGDHPDCIQAWSIAGQRPTANVTVTGNVGYGNMQGIFFGNHIVNGVNDGGYDNITFSNNAMTVGMANGIRIDGARTASITGNTVATTPGAVYANNPSMPLRAELRVLTSTNVRACGNRVAGAPANMVGLQACQ